MNEAQLRKYRVEWNKVRQVLRADGVSPKDADAKRHAIHIEALGSDKSSLDLTNREFDEVLKRFQAISQPANLRGQIDLEAMPESRKRFAISRLLAALGKDESHVEHLIESRRAAGRLVTVVGDAAASFETVGEADLQRVMLDLKRQCQKRWPRKGDLLTEIRLLRMECEFDEVSTRAAVIDALKLRQLPELHTLAYDQLLVVVGTMRTIATGALKTASADPDWTV